MTDIEKCSELECLARESLLAAWREIEPGLQEKQPKPWYPNYLVP
jgi:hypothetical protein